MTPSSTAPQLAEGFQTRYFEFQDFERRFEECISKSAVKTKFDQHAQRGRAITTDMKNALDFALERAQNEREAREAERRKVRAELESTEHGLSNATRDAKDMINQMVEDVEQRVSRALSEEIRRLAVLIDEFSVPFHAEPLVLNVYKRELHAHVEQGLGSNLRSRLSAALATNVEHGQVEMLKRMEALIPEAQRRAAGNAGVASLLQSRRPFELLYRLNCDNLCADFHEDLDFRFTWGITALIQRYCSGKRQQAIKNGQIDRGIEPNTSVVAVNDVNSINSLADEWSIVSRVAMLSASTAGTQGTFGSLIVGGFLVKTVGWRLIAFTAAIYACLYAYERLTWTNKAKERQFKKQYVEHATKKLRLIVDLTSANCSHQVQQELSGTFARLCHAVDEAAADMVATSTHLESEVRRLEDAAAGARVLRNKAGYLTHELDLFEEAYLKPDGI